ncbi:MAG: hypothetical protein D6714_14570 [Bacteroidetes bacterium]|nr:MAG: hypothetical protein D6714_14570 [Bacteroidota bacterium]
MEQEAAHPPPKEIEENIFRNLHILQLLGDTMELYIPNAFDLFVDMLGGNVENKEFDVLAFPLTGGLPDNDETASPNSSSDANPDFLL